MVDGAELERPEWAAQLQALEGIDNFFRIGRAGFSDAGRDRLDRQIADDRAQLGTSW